MAKFLAITIPKWGIEMEQGTILEWRVAPGATIAKGDELVDIETDKIVNSFEATDDGVLVRIIAQEGEELKVGTLIGVMASEEVAEEEIDAFIAANSLGESSPITAADQPVLASIADTPELSSSGELRISPAMRRKAERLGIDISMIAGSGYGGRILRDDIEAARSLGTHSSLHQLRGAQKTIAERMSFSKQTIPHFYLHRDCAMDNLLDNLESARTDSNVAITVNHMLVHAVAQALQQHPELNLNVLPSGVKQLKSTSVAIAVDTGESLLTPVVRDIGELDLRDVAQQAAEVVERTRNKQLAAGDMDGAAITVSNLGMFGVTSFTAIINPPQVMILAVGAIQKRVVLNGDKPELARFCALTLACDHRVVNGAAGARFLATVCETLETVQA